MSKGSLDAVPTIGGLAPSPTTEAEPLEAENRMAGYRCSALPAHNPHDSGRYCVRNTTSAVESPDPCSASAARAERWLPTWRLASVERRPCSAKPDAMARRGTMINKSDGELKAFQAEQYEQGSRAHYLMDGKRAQHMRIQFCYLQ